MDPVAALLVNLVLAFYYAVESLYRLFFPRQPKDITSDVVLVTGAANGLGRALAHKFAQRGARVVLWDIDKQALEETTAQMTAVGAMVFSYVVDVTDRDRVYEVAARVKQEVGPVTMLVNNAGVVSGKSFLDLSDGDVLRTFNVNAISHFWVIDSSNYTLGCVIDYLP